LGERTAAAFRPLVMLSIAFLAISGIYNLLGNPGHTLRYHIVLGVKLLLVAHIFAVAVLITRPHHPRRVRLMAGGAISSLIVIGIAAYLHRIF
jgi:Na+-transporting NADH:ubiquinone oxidoreductase subunit NqrD